MSQIRDQMISRLAASTYTSFSSDFSCTDPAPKFPDGQEKVLEGDVHVKKKKRCCSVSILFARQGGLSPDDWMCFDVFREMTVKGFPVSENSTPS